jgi:hypothetical protein
MTDTLSSSATGATYSLYVQTDMTNPDYATFAQGTITYSVLNNVTYNGITYQNLLELNSQVGSTTESLLIYGSNFQYSLNGSTVSVSGTVNAVVTESSSGQGGTITSSLTGINVSASALEQALQLAYNNPTTANEIAVAQLFFQGNDTIYGSPYNDVLYGYGPNTTFIPGAGSDQITGTSGTNVVVFSNSIQQYTIANSGNVITVANNAAGGITDTLTNIQQVKFSDITLVFNLHSSEDTLVYELYQATYARTPDLAGFTYWAGVADANNTSALALADAFLAAPEFTQKYGANPSNTAYITELYTNVLGRTPDQAGLNYWIGQANSGTPRDQLLVDFAVSQENVNLIAPHISHGYWTT